MCICEKFIEVHGLGGKVFTGVFGQGVVIDEDKYYFRVVYPMSGSYNITYPKTVETIACIQSNSPEDVTRIQESIAKLKMKEAKPLKSRVVNVKSSKSTPTKKISPELLNILLASGADKSRLGL